VKRKTSLLVVNTTNNNPCRRFRDLHLHSFSTRCIYSTGKHIPRAAV